MEETLSLAVLLRFPLFWLDPDWVKFPALVILGSASALFACLVDSWRVISFEGSTDRTELRLLTGAETVKHEQK